MTRTRSDALVFFGVTGDLAYKQVFPALQAMIRRGHFDMPIIGVAGRPWSIEQLQAHVHNSLEEHGVEDNRSHPGERESCQGVCTKYLGPPEADQLIACDGGWHNPAPDAPAETSVPQPAKEG